MGRKYEKDYKPNICYVNCKLYYYHEKDQPKIDRTLSKELKRSFYKSIEVKGLVMVLDDNCKIPTANMKEISVKRIWKICSIKGKLKEHRTSIVNINIISNHGRVSYDFDELIH